MGLQKVVAVQANLNKLCAIYECTFGANTCGIQAWLGVTRPVFRVRHDTYRLLKRSNDSLANLLGS